MDADEPGATFTKWVLAATVGLRAPSVKDTLTPLSIAVIPFTIFKSNSVIKIKIKIKNKIQDDTQIQ